MTAGFAGHGVGVATLVLRDSQQVGAGCGPATAAAWADGRGAVYARSGLPTLNSSSSSQRNHELSVEMRRYSVAFAGRGAEVSSSRRYNFKVDTADVA